MVLVGLEVGVGLAEVGVPAGRSTPAAIARSSTRRILPVAVVGKVSVKTTARGRLNYGSPARQCSISWASVTAAPGASTT